MKKFLLLIALIISGLGLNAQSVGSSSIVYYDGYSLKFTVTKLDPAECKVVCDTKPTTPVAVSIPSSVTIEGSTFCVTSIGNSAFSYCSGLTSIEIPNSVTSIGNWAFSNCFGLTSIEIPNSVTSIGNSAFSSCSNLESIVVESGNTVYDSRNNCNAIIETSTNTLHSGCKNTVIPNNVTSIGNSAFSFCSGLTSIEIPNSVTSIGNSAFYYCDGLTSIEIPNSVTSIGNSAFYNCDGLTSIEIPNSVTSIGESAFYSCSSLESIVVESGNTVYDSRNNCNAIIETSTNTLHSGCKNTVIPNNVTSIGNSAFSFCSGLTSIEIPNSVTSIGESAFIWCSHLRSIKCHAVDVPVTATNAFNNCPEDMNIQVPEGSVALYQAAQPWNNYNVTKMYPYQNGDYVVINYEGYSLRFTIENVEPAECEVVCETEPETGTSITIPSSVEIGGVECSVTKIGNAAFYNCNGLTSIEIPNSVTSIGNSAFYSCSGLTSIEIPNSVTSIGNSAFSFCNDLTSIEIPNSVTSIGESAFIYCSSLERIVVESGNTVYDSRNNCNAIIETQTNTLLYGCMNTIIPNSVTSIGNSAFYYCNGLTSIEIPNSVTSIGNYAFYSCSGLTSIEIPNSVTSIGESAFIYCSSLERIVVESGNTVYDSRNNCNAIIETQTNTLLYGCMNTIIPNSVTSIGESAFRSCYGLKSIEIPNSVTSIGNEAFNYCTGLTSIKCHAVDVPVTATNAFNNCPEDMNIQVPEAAVSLYKATSPWNNYNVTKMYPYQNGDYVVIDYEGYSLRFTIENVEPAECEVVCETEPETGTSITIPSSVEIGGVECSVTKIGNGAFGWCSNLTSIEIPSSVTSIGNKAFYYTPDLESIVVEGGNTNYDSRSNCNAIIETQTNTLLYGCKNTVIPNSVTSIGNDAFYYCTNLTSIEIPSSVTSIGNYVFDNCSNLTSVKCQAEIVPETEETAFNNCPEDMNIQVPAASLTLYQNAVPWNNYNITPFLSYGDYSLSFEVTSSDPAECIVFCSGNPATETSVNIPSEVTIGDVTYSVTTIGYEAFIECSNITSIVIPNSVTTISPYAFDGCTGLTSIMIPRNVTTIERGILAGCINIATIEVDDNNSVYNDRGNAIIETETNTLVAGCKNTVIPDNTTKIADQAFRLCSTLTEMEIPNTVTYIGTSAFYGCTGLTGNLVIPNSVTYIGICAFWECRGFDGTLTLPNNIDTIRECTFGSYDGVMGFTGELIIPNNVKYIGQAAFQKCSSISGVKLSDNLTRVDRYAFYGCSSITEVEIPNDVTYLGANSFANNSSLTELTFEDNSQLDTIASYAFTGCESLLELDFPNSLVYIGMYSFANTYSLTSIRFPSSLNIYGLSAFTNCRSLESIIVDEDNTSFDSRDNCNALITSSNVLLLGCKNTNIPDGIVSIRNVAFLSCIGLTSIDIPATVNNIEHSAFNNCSNLTNIKCYAENVPPTVTNAFNNCPEDMTIQVPEESVALYQAAEPWNNFNIVAGFNSNINVSSNITEGGFVEGGGNYQDGTEITVSAYVNPNYGFLYWSENDEIVSYCPNYSFIVSEDRNLVANFAINHWIPDYTIYPNFMAITGVVQIDGIEQSDSNIEVGAFCGDELRGSNRLIYECEYDRYYLYLTIYGKDDDEISFRIYDNSEETELELYYNETMNFIVDDIVGNVGDPKIFNFTTDYIHKQQLTSNWNWYSTFVDVDGREGFEMMKEGLGEFGIQIKSQSVFSNYNAGNWNGGLNTVSTGNMYMIKVSEPIELSMSGVIVEPSEFPIVINTNWKWIPYPVQEEMDIASAFANFTPNDGDIVKSQDGFTQYYQGIGWNGSLNTMMPGQGYMYQNTSGEEKILYYPTQGENRNALKANVTTENNYWKPEVTEYPTNMNVIAVVNNASDDYEIGAFCNGECRGSARPLYIEGLDKHIVFMTVYGDEEETIYLKYYDINNDEEYAVSDAFTFTVNAVLGNTMNPYVISLVPANVGEISTNGLNIYPNPANVNEAINFTREYEKVEIYNALGVKIAEYENRDYIDGIENAGIYVIKITDDGMTEYDRIIVN